MSPRLTASISLSLDVLPGPFACRHCHHTWDILLLDPPRHAWCWGWGWYWASTPQGPVRTLSDNADPCMAVLLGVCDHSRSCFGRGGLHCVRVQTFCACVTGLTKSVCCGQARSSLCPWSALCPSHCLSVPLCLVRVSYGKGRTEPEGVNHSSHSAHPFRLSYHHLRGLPG